MAKASTPGIRRLEWAGVATFAVLEVWLVARLAPGARAAPWLALIAVVLAYLTADLVCGLVHWTADTWGPPDLPVVGRAFLRPFREHHLDPLAITRHDFADTNGNSCLVCLPVLGLALWLAPGGDGPGNVFLPAFLGALVWWAMLTNEFHKWAHLSDPGRVVALLQRLHLILTPANHAHHHIPPFNSHYCITLGWMNRPLARARFFARLEWFITRCTGVRPRREEMGIPAAAGVSAKILPLPTPRPVPPPVRSTWTRSWQPSGPA